MTNITDYSRVTSEKDALYMNKILILLPSRISVLRNIANQDIVTYFDEFSIYYKNIIYPYSTEYDIQIDCEYGNNSVIAGD